MRNSETYIKKKYKNAYAIITFDKLKTSNGWSNKIFNELLEILHDLLPNDNVMFMSIYLVKKLLRTFVLGYEKIHASANDCCLFTKETENMESFKVEARQT